MDEYEMLKAEIQQLQREVAKQNPDPYC